MNMKQQLMIQQLYSEKANGKSAEVAKDVSAPKAPAKKAKPKAVKSNG